MIMKKSLLFIVALCATVALNAKTITLEPGSGKIAEAVASAEAGDIIELTGDGTAEYVEGNSIQIDKAITIRAAEGATPVVHIMKFKMDAAFAVEGIEFYGYEDYMFRTYAGGEFALSFKNCLIRNSSAYFIYISSGQSINALTIDGCIFHDNTKDENAVVNGSGTIGTFTFTNNTVYNIPGKYAVRVKGLTSAVVDHCTFYNCGKTPLAFGETAATNISVSNTTFSNPALVDGDAMIFYNYGAVDNCVYFNTSGCANWMATQTNTINADPLFADPANGDFNFKFTSPLFLAATDGTHIGDLRWGVVEPETAIAVPDTLPAMQAVLCGTKISASENGIAWNGNSANPNDNSASWVIDVAKAGNYEVVIYEASESGHSFMACVANNETWLDTITEKSSTNWTHNEDITIGTFTFDAPGKYLVRLMNGMKNSSGIAKYCIMNYAGGAVVDIPDTLPNEDAILSGSSTINEQGYISFSNNNIPENFWAKWNVNFEMAGSFKITANILPNETTHDFKIALLDAEGTEIQSLNRGNHGTEGVLDYGTLIVSEAGKYSILITNNTQWSSSLFKDVTITYAGGAVIDVPATLPNEEALLTGSKITRTADGIAWGNNIDVTEDYATWNISVAEEGDYLVTMAVRTGETSGHEFFIKIFNGDSQQVGETITETTKTPITLAAGTYTVHLGNNKQWSSAVMASVAIKSASGTVVEMPGTLQADDALLGGDDNVKVDGDGYICFSKDENVPNCWATWQTNWVKTGTYDVIMDVNATNGHKLVVEVLDGETVIKTFEHGYSTESGKLSIGKFVLSETKSYTIRLTNKQTWSDARIKSIAFIPFIAIGNDDEDVDFTEYENQFVSVQLNRTFTGGMYNPICVPFAVNEKKLEAIFGVNKAYYLDVSNTYMDGQKLFINLKADGGIYQGVPYFVAPATNVVNPIFHNVQISQVNAQATNVSDVIKLQGNYSKEELPKPTLSLLLGANNTLFFSSDETPYVKSMRAYFELPSEEVKKAVRHISLSDGYNAPTWMPIIGVESESESGKFIRDGRFVIVREGKEYGILGVEE